MTAAMTPKDTTMNQADPGALIAPVRAIARKAGDEILKIYRTDFAVRAKADASPVTDADEAAERIIVAELARIAPDITIVAEEAATVKMPDAGSRDFWAVDPLDGTREFIKRNDEFTVNIALIADRRPVLGVLHAPALGLTYSAAGAGTAMCQEGDAPARPTFTPVSGHAAKGTRRPARPYSKPPAAASPPSTAERFSTASPAS